MRMLALVMLGLALWFGYALIRRLPLTLRRFEAYSAAIFLGLFLGTWLNWLLSFIFGYNFGAILTVALLLVTGLYLWRTKRLTIQPQTKSERFAWVVFSTLTSWGTI